MAAAQAPPKAAAPIAPKTEQLDSKACANSDTQTRVDPEIRQPTPPGGAMPVIPPPGTPGGDQSVQPK
jgi:hypothetical protein